MGAPDRCGRVCLLAFRQSSVPVLVSCAERVGRFDTTSEIIFPLIMRLVSKLEMRPSVSFFGIVMSIEFKAMDSEVESLTDKTTDRSKMEMRNMTPEDNNTLLQTQAFRVA